MIYLGVGSEINKSVEQGAGSYIFRHLGGQNSVFIKTNVSASWGLRPPQIPHYSCLTYSDALTCSEVFRFYLRRLTKFRRNIRLDIFLNTYWMKPHTVIGSFLYEGY